MHQSISIQNLHISFGPKTLVENLSTQIPYGSRIGIIGRNGSGKSTFLKILQNIVEAKSGRVKLPCDIQFGYVPQVIDEYEALSGGQRFNQLLTHALAQDPNFLILDEPTCHLDLKNRQSLIRKLQTYEGTLIFVSHDPQLLEHCADTLWHLECGQVKIFQGDYTHYRHEIQLKRQVIEEKIKQIDRNKKAIHHSLMKEQQRAAKGKKSGKKKIQNRKWAAVVSPSKFGRANKTSDKKKGALLHKKEKLSQERSNLKLPEVIIPQFSIEASNCGHKTLVSIFNGSIGYSISSPILEKISLTIGNSQKVAICGNNGSGKSTLVKAILDNKKCLKRGVWHVPKPQDIGYLDQHYANLNPNQSVYNAIASVVPSWHMGDIRCHLNAFLFRKNDEVDNLIAHLSGGEKARLSLALIAAKPPKLLILDEVTNNLDMETKDHVTQILREYPGAMIVISHDEDFLKDLNLDLTLEIKNRSLR